MHQESFESGFKSSLSRSSTRRGRPMQPIYPLRTPPDQPTARLLTKFSHNKRDFHIEWAVQVVNQT